MNHKFVSVCPLDCPDGCSLLVQVDGGIISKIAGNPDHSTTNGFICSKGRRLSERIHHPERVMTPMRRKNGNWQKITWNDAYDIIFDKLSSITEKYGSLAIYHHYEAGSEGVLNNLDRRFFNALGGATEPTGSLCWGAGYAATEYDYGGVYSNDWSDLVNARTILIWGRNVGTTNLHIIPFIKEAKNKGAKIIVINPIKANIANLADKTLALRPGTDGALALGIANVILQNGWADLDFITKYVHGFEEFLKLVKDFSPTNVAYITGISQQDILEVARTFSINRPASILLGFGLQRYSNSGKAVRAINALSALTGNIGKPGAGVNYAHQYWKGMFYDLAGKDLAKVTRKFKRPTLAEDILKANNPPIKALFVTRSNPVNQLPSTAKVLEAFRKVDFKVVIDFFINDTADLADLFLPCATIFEEENLVLSGWNTYLKYSPKLIEPLGQTKTDAQIFSDLAEKFNLDEFPRLSAEEWLKKYLAPAEKYGLNLKLIKEKGVVKCPLAKQVAWENLNFKTPSGKYELFSLKALEEGLDPLPTYSEPSESKLRNSKFAEEYPLHLITSHHKDYLNSQFYNFMKPGEGTTLPEVEIHPDTAVEKYIRENDQVLVETARGQLKGIAKLNKNLRKDVLQIFQGWWIKDGGGINFLTPDTESDLGIGTAYYDCLCQIRKYLE